jgi:hypothetical protein
VSEAARDAWGLAVASLLGGEEPRLRGRVLDVGGGAAIFARTLPEAQLLSAELDDIAVPADASRAHPEQFDAALSISQLQFAEVPGGHVAAMVAACRVGGIVLLIVPHALQEDLADALHAFTLRGLHALASAAGLDVEYVRAINPPEGGVLRRELEAFSLQSARHIVVPDELEGWVDVMDEQRPMLLACLGVKSGPDGNALASSMHF